MHCENVGSDPVYLRYVNFVGILALKMSQILSGEVEVNFSLEIQPGPRLSSLIGTPLVSGIERSSWHDPLPE